MKCLLSLLLLFCTLNCAISSASASPPQILHDGNRPEESSTTNLNLKELQLDFSKRRGSFISPQDQKFLSPTPYQEQDIIIRQLTNNKFNEKELLSGAGVNGGRKNRRNRVKNSELSSAVTLDPRASPTVLPYQFQRAQKDRREEFSPFTFKRSPSTERFQGLKPGESWDSQISAGSQISKRGTIRYTDIVNQRNSQRENQRDNRRTFEIDNIEDGGVGDGGLFDDLNKIPGPEIILKLEKSSGPSGASETSGSREGRSFNNGRGRSGSRFIPPEKLIQVEHLLNSKSHKRDPHNPYKYQDQEDQQQDSKFRPIHRNIQEILQSTETNGGGKQYLSDSSEERTRFGEHHQLYIQKLRNSPLYTAASVDSRQKQKKNQDFIRSLGGGVTFGSDNPHRDDYDDQVRESRTLSFHRDYPEPPPLALRRSSTDLRDVRRPQPSRHNREFSRLDLSHFARPSDHSHSSSISSRNHGDFQPSLSFPPSSLESSSSNSNRRRSSAYLKELEPLEQYRVQPSESDIHYDPFLNFGDLASERNRRNPQKRLVSPSSGPAPRTSSHFNLNSHRESNAYPLYPQHSGPSSSISTPLFHNPNKFLTNYDILGPGGAQSATSANLKLSPSNFRGPNDVDCRNCHDAPRDTNIFTIQVGTQLKVKDDGRPGNRQFFVQDERQGDTRRYP